MKISTFVDRVEYIGALMELAESVDRGQSRALAIEGPLGIGKSALLDEVSRQIQERTTEPALRVIRARCQAFVGEANAYGPVMALFDALQPPRAARRIKQATVQYLPDIVGTLPAVGPALAAAMQITRSAIDSGSVQGDSLLPYRQSAAHGLASALLGALTEKGPTLVLIDDVQWIDPSSLLVLDHLMEEFWGSPVGLVLAHGTDRDSDSSIRELLDQWHLRGRLERTTLGGLSDDAVAELVRLHYDGPVSPAVLGQLNRLTGGRPAYVAQFLPLIGTDGGLDGPLPTVLRRAVRRSMERLETSDRELLVASASQGVTFLASVVARTTDREEEEVQDQLHRLSRKHGIITALPNPDWAPNTDRYQFDDLLLQMELYAEQSANRCRQRHTRIAKALMAFGDELPLAVRLDYARHFRAGAPHPASGAEHLKLARDVAVNGLSFAEAETLCRFAVHEIKRLPDHTADRDRLLAQAIELLLNLTEVHWHTRRRPKGDDLEGLAAQAETAARSCGDPALTARTVMLHGKVLLHTQGLVPSLEKLKQAVELARGTDDPLALFVALAEHGRQLSKRDLNDGLAVLQEAQRLYETGLRLHDPSDPILRHARNLTEMQLGVNLFDAGDFGTALEHLTACVERLREDPLRAELPIALNYLSQLHSAMRDSNSAESFLREALAFEEDRGGPSGWHAYNSALLAQLMACDPARRHACRPILTEAWRETEQTWLLNLVPIVRNLYAEVLVLLSDTNPALLDEALRLAGDTIEETRRTGMVRSEIAALSLSSRIYSLHGEIETAAALARESLSILQRMGDLPALRTEEIFLHTADILEAAGDQETASWLRADAQVRISRIADTLTDPAQRDRYLRKILPIVPS
ncbi:AAA family ATPase [Streptosporangium sp. NPDC006930]|uniref:ATP-binding protein n=1 Tax=Streptosporangium sp. NPDC006930 TaxID=3154783 RepID=UPI0034323F17